MVALLPPEIGLLTFSATSNISNRVKNGSNTHPGGSWRFHVPFMYLSLTLADSTKITNPSDSSACPRRAF